MAAPYHGRTTRSFKRLRARLLEESDICWLCGQAGADTADHVIPLSLAPHLAEEADNLRPAHRGCNSSRGARLGLPRALPSSRSW
jgi:5-methylcytosine-specific restriction endonuclease McrA